MNSAPLVSVIIPAYNQAHYLGEAIRSALSQTNPHLEVLVIDDGSTDATAQVAAQFRDERVQYFFQNNAGLPAARRMAKDARALMRERVHPGDKVKLLGMSRGKYFRIVATVILPDGTSWAAIVQGATLARPYGGGNKADAWK